MGRRVSRGACKPAEHRGGGYLPPDGVSGKNRISETDQYLWARLPGMYGKLLRYRTFFRDACIWEVMLRKDTK